MSRDPHAPRAFQIDRPHFGYGSNMWPPWLWKDAPSARERGAAHLDGWTLRFRKRSQKDGSAKADIAKVGGVVRGGLFDIATNDLRDLNEKEGGYVPVPVTVRDLAGEPIDAWTYTTKSTNTRGPLWPYRWYLELVQRGADHFDLPKAYRERLRARRGKARRQRATRSGGREVPRRQSRAFSRAVGVDVVSAARPLAVT